MSGPRSVQDVVRGMKLAAGFNQEAVTQLADMADAYEAKISALDIANEALATALEKCKQACLFTDDDGQMSVTNDPCISNDLFDLICAVLARHRGADE